MATQNPTSPMMQGIRDGLPFLLVICPFGLLFGVVASEAGLDIGTAFAFSLAVIAGAAQFTALAQLQDQAAVWLAILMALAVNLRMAMYSAALTPHMGKAPVWKRALVAYLLVDQVYSCSILRFEQNPQWSTAQKYSYFFGAALPVCPMWPVMTVVGAMMGSAIPESWALDFAVPITFLAMIAPMLRSLPHVAAAVTSVIAALVLMGLPSGLGLIVAAVIAMMVGARVELWMEARNG